MECCKVLCGFHKVGTPVQRPSTVRGLKLHSRVPVVKLQARAPLRVRAVIEDAAPHTVNGPPMAMSTRSPNRRSTTTTDEESCEMAFVDVNNDIDDTFTVISLKVKSFPGLMRLVTWVLTGLRINVRRASLRTDLQTGIAEDLFYVCDEKGNKLKNPEEVAARLTDFVQYCSPRSEAFEATVFEQGPIKIDNAVHPTYTAMSMKHMEGGYKLLEVVSALAGVGLIIAQADINCVDCEAVGKWRFYLQTAKGKKLDYVQISGLIYTLTHVLEL